jgi:ubiquinol-cytochrome c reductase cytochrome c subunit
VDRTVLDDLRDPVRSRIRRGSLAVFALLLLPGSFFFLLPAGQAEPVRGIVGSIARGATLQSDAGRSLYEERCATCHGDSAEGTEQGPSIVGLGAAAYDFQLSTGRMPLEQPTDQPIRRRPVLSRGQIDAIIVYLESIAPGGPGIPDVRPDEGDLSEGEEIYRLDCAPCHGVSGNGGAVGPRTAPNVRDATPTQVGEAVRTGPTTMPVFGEGTVSDEELNSLARYIQYLRDPLDRGGAGLNHVGPLIEGFVALLIGLGVLVVVTRLLGERS